MARLRDERRPKGKPLSKVIFMPSGEGKAEAEPLEFPRQNNQHFMQISNRIGSLPARSESTISFSSARLASQSHNARVH